MTSPQQLRRHRQQLETLCATTLRALCDKPALRYREHQLYDGDTRVAGRAPHLRVNDDDDLPAYRGAADGMALRLLYSDAVRFKRQAPGDAEAHLMFDWLEQLRVESLAPPHLPGIRANVEARFAAWSRAFVHARLLEEEIGEIIYTIAQVSRSRLTGQPVPADSADIIEARRGTIVATLGHALSELRPKRHDQSAFAKPALEIAHYLAEQVAAARRAPHADKDTDQTPLTMLLDLNGEATGQTAAPAPHDADMAPTADSCDYRAFTTAYDSEQPVERLVRWHQLTRLRSELDTAMTKLHVNPRRLAQHFRACLSAPRRSGWRFGEEEGYVDGRRLAQIVANPTERRIFTVAAMQSRPDTTVALLLDCSGSMKVHGLFLALIIDRLASALHMAGLPCEILGFTTGAWNGGRARRDWQQAGQPPRPGRLNEVSHLVFKNSRMPWRRARYNLGALLKGDLYREGIDGEAVAWAGTRLATATTTRRILVVFSDGSPMDGATQLANGPHYLDNHLRHVVSDQARHGIVEVKALGVGLDLSPSYEDNLILDPQAPIDNHLLGEIAVFITNR